jgi:hypothetical protein
MQERYAISDKLIRYMLCTLACISCTYTRHMFTDIRHTRYKYAISTQYDGEYTYHGGYVIQHHVF